MSPSEQRKVELTDWQLMRACNPHFYLIIEECARAVLAESYRRWQQGDSEGAKYAQAELAGAILALKDKR